MCESPSDRVGDGPVSHALDVILLNLEPLVTSLVGLVGRSRAAGVESLDHETLARGGHRLVEEGEDLLSVGRIPARRKHESALYFVETLPHLIPPLLQGLLDEGLPIEVEHIECKETNLDLDLALVRLLPLPRAEDLERKDLLGLTVISHNLAVEHKVRRALGHDLWKHLYNVGILAGVVLTIATVNLDRAIGQLVDLPPLPVVLVLAGEILVGKSIQHFTDALCRVGKHGLDGDAGGEEAMLGQLLDRPL